MTKTYEHDNKGECDKYIQARQNLRKSYNKHHQHRKNRSTILILQPHIENQIKFRKRS